MEIIRTQNINKSFGDTKANDDITLHVKQGEIYGFLGLNGAGKTTLIRILLGMIKANTGDVFLFNKKLNRQFKAWNEIGYLVETPHSYPNLTVYENLKVYYNMRKLKDTKVIDDSIDSLKLSKYKDVQEKHLSMGNKQRLGLAKALMHNPKLLILDEPVNGLDPEGIVEVRELLFEFAKQGSTVFLSSHILGEISKLADRIGIIHEGKLIKELNSQELEEQLIKKILIQTNDNTTALELLKRNYNEISLTDNEIELTDQGGIEHPEKITKILSDANLAPKEIKLFTEDLEDFFLRSIHR
jgi:ABC-2 type transport system ATP-binding protein